MSRFKKDDQVKIMSGKDKNKTGKIISVKNDKVLIAGLNMVKKKIKPKSQQEKGGIIDIEAPLHVSNVMLLSKGSTSRIGYKTVDGVKKRVAKKTGEIL